MKPKIGDRLYYKFAGKNFSTARFFLGQKEIKFKGFKILLRLWEYHPRLNGAISKNIGYICTANIINRNSSLGYRIANGKVRFNYKTLKKLDNYKQKVFLSKEKYRKSHN